MARVTGIGGVFLKAQDPKGLSAWYAKHLGIADKGEGAMLPWREHDDSTKEHVTVWTVFPAWLRNLCFQRGGAFSNP